MKEIRTYVDDGRMCSGSGNGRRFVRVVVCN